MRCWFIPIRPVTPFMMIPTTRCATLLPLRKAFATAQCNGNHGKRKGGRSDPDRPPLRARGDLKEPGPLGAFGLPPRERDRARRLLGRLAPGPQADAERDLHGALGLGQGALDRLPTFSLTVLVPAPVNFTLPAASVVRFRPSCLATLLRDGELRRAGHRLGARDLDRQAALGELRHRGRGRLAHTEPRLHRRGRGSGRSGAFGAAAGGAGGGAAVPRSRRSGPSPCPCRPSDRSTVSVAV